MVEELILTYRDVFDLVIESLTLNKDDECNSDNW